MAQVKYDFWKVYENYTHEPALTQRL